MRERLVKLLNLTRSNNDHEALASIRAANASLDKSGMSWEALVGPDVDSVQRGPVKPNAPQRSQTTIEPEDVEGMISYVRANAWSGFDFSFVDDIEQKFELYGRLTYGQAKGLKAVFESVLKYRGG